MNTAHSRFTAVTTAYQGTASLEQIAGSSGLLFVRNGCGFAGQGEIARVTADEAVATLEIC
jgi:L-arabinose isomerase